MSAAGTVAPSANATQNLFAGSLFAALAAASPHTNVVYSPVSIHSCLTLLFFGADGVTAQEMRETLKLPAAIGRKEIAVKYDEFMRKFQLKAGPQLLMANRVYVNEGLRVRREFNEIAAKHFRSSAENVRFADSAAAVHKINAWVEEQTQHKIRNLLAEGTVDGRTSAVLVNAIYFKALWQMPFSATSTHMAPFNVAPKQQVQVAMMSLNDDFKYGEFPDLQASALEMPYKDTDLTMLILLPHSIDGLAELERKLAQTELNGLTGRMKVHDVEVLLPKFRVEYDINLNGVLKKMGIQRMFSDAAEFKHLFEDEPQQKVSDVVHKAYLDVNEAGSEAAAATFSKLVPMSLKFDQKLFKADHPFLFAIRDKGAVYFAGHVVKF